MITKEELVQTILVSTAQFQERFDKDSKPDVSKRNEILQSEVWETLKAIAENDIVEIADGFIDQLYVLGGSIDKFKFDKEIAKTYSLQFNEVLERAIQYFNLDCLFECFNDIHLSNMSKVHLSFFHVQETFDRYHLDVKDWRIKQISETEILVYDNSINKLLKPSNYKKANLKPILQKYGYC
jgi:predicted HAD superfamily Cof-like phosphohydrolase